MRYCSYCHGPTTSNQALCDGCEEANRPGDAARSGLCKKIEIIQSSSLPLQYKVQYLNLLGAEFKRNGQIEHSKLLCRAAKDAPKR